MFHYKGLCSRSFREENSGKEARDSEEVTRSGGISGPSRLLQVRRMMAVRQDKCQNESILPGFHGDVSMLRERTKK
jgi:hypothetical protein